MTSDVKSILEEALKLPPEARAALAGSLLESLDVPTDDDVEEAWSQEVEKRLNELNSGKIKGIPWTMARRKILGG